MKKELLMASALVSTLGVTSVAQAVTATMAGSMKVGAEFESADNSTVDSNTVMDQSNFNISLSETTDGGTTISTSFEIVDEGTVSADDDNAIKLTFTDGSALELLKLVAQLEHTLLLFLVQAENKVLLELLLTTRLAILISVQVQLL